METLTDVWPAGLFLVAYTTAILTAVWWMLKFQASKTDDKLKSIHSLLTNHISETNKKIDNLSERIDRQSERFDRLYEVLLKEKGQK